MIDDILARMQTPASSKRHISFKALFTKRSLAYALAAAILIATGYVSVDTWLINRRVAAETSPPSSATESTAPTDNKATSSTTVNLPDGADTSKPVASALDSYKVPDDQPRALYISKIGVRARVLNVGVTSDGNLATPKNIYDSGWYNASAKPGLPGAMVIDGHASGATRVGLFAYLDKLAEGDEITVEKGDGAKLTYKVVHKDITPKDEVDMKTFLAPYNGIHEGLNLITCTGKWIESQKTYDHRVLIYAERV